VDCGVLLIEYCVLWIEWMWIVYCRLSIVNLYCGLRIEYCVLSIVDCGLCIVYCVLWIVD